MNPPAARLDAHRHGAPVAERCTENNAEASHGRVFAGRRVRSRPRRAKEIRFVSVDIMGGGHQSMNA